MNYPDSKGKKKQKKKPIKKVPNSNPSTLIEPSQQRVAFSNNRVHPQRARRFTMSSGGSNPSTILSLFRYVIMHVLKQKKVCYVMSLVSIYLD